MIIIGGMRGGKTAYLHMLSERTVPCCLDCGSECEAWAFRCLPCRRGRRLHFALGLTR